MTLRAELRIVRDQGFRLDLELTVGVGEVVALLGPNGAGKTTTLRALAGLLPVTDGIIRLDDQVWDHPPKVFRTTDSRPVGVVFQDYLLFNHLSARDNIAFGLRARGSSRRDAHDEALRWLDRLDLVGVARTRPRSLSGGQAQRVALARALATRPELLLLDEPLAALDATSTQHVRTELGRHLGSYGGRTLLVTHDPLDAMVLADRIVIIENGRAVQQGPPAEIARRPRTDYVADLVGLNLHPGHADGTAVELDDGGRLLIAEPTSGAVHLAFAPSAVSLHPDRPGGSPRNAWPVTVAGVEQRAHTVRVRLDGPPGVVAEVTTAAVAELRLTPGTRLWAALKATEIQTYPR